MMLMQNPNLEMEWPTEQLFRTMVRHQAVYELPQESLESSIGNDNMFLASIERLLPCSLIRKELLNETKRFQSLTPETQFVPLPLEAFELSAALEKWEQQKLDYNTLQSVLQQMQDLDSYVKRELVELELRCMLERLVMKRPADKEELEVAELEQLVRIERIERNSAVARLRHQEALRDLEKAAPHNVLQCLALNNAAPFSLESVSPSRVDISFSCATEGPRPCLRWDSKQGISSFVMPVSSRIAERAPTIPADHIAASFYRQLLFVDGTNKLNIHPLILQHVLSSDISQTVLSLSVLMGRMDLALVDLVRVTTKSYIGNVSAERKGDSLLLSISFLDELHVQFYYDCRSERSLAHTIPSRVRVIRAGLRRESLEVEAQQTIHSGTSPCLERICDAFFLASCV